MAPNYGAVRFGLTLESHKDCVDHSLWDNPLVHHGPEKGGLWFRDRWTLTFCLPFGRWTKVWRRPAPPSVKAHEAQLRSIVKERRAMRRTRG